MKFAPLFLLMLGGLPGENPVPDDVVQDFLCRSTLPYWGDVMEVAQHPRAERVFISVAIQSDMLSWLEVLDEDPEGVEVSITSRMVTRVGTGEAVGEGFIVHRGTGPFDGRVDFQGLSGGEKRSSHRWDWVEWEVPSAAFVGTGKVDVPIYGLQTATVKWLGTDEYVGFFLSSNTSRVKIRMEISG